MDISQRDVYHRRRDMARETCLPDIQDAQLTQVKNMARVQPPPAEETAADVKETGSDV